MTLMGLGALLKFLPLHSLVRNGGGGAFALVRMKWPVGWTVSQIARHSYLNLQASR